MSLNGKTAIVTGAAQGIGQATAIRLAADGAHVVAADIQDCEVTLKEIAEAGGSAEAVRLDVRVADDWSAAVEQITASRGSVDCLANVAGVVNMISETPSSVSPRKRGTSSSAPTSRVCGSACGRSSRA